MIVPRLPRIRAGRIFEPLGWGFVFALAHGQLPLYSGNQNTYLLHAVARVEPAGLAQDWVARTLDPFPLFTGLSVALMRLAPDVLQIAYGTLLLVYGAALWGLVRMATPASGWPGRTAATSFLVLLHSVQLSFLARNLRDPWTPEFWTGGLASQYVLGPVWQPCVFGALLVLAVALAVRRRAVAAVACAVAAQAFHASYMLSAAMLIAGIAWAAWSTEEKPWRAFGLLVGGAVAMLPFVVFNGLRFGPTDPQAFAAAQTVLFSERIPQHANPAFWWTPLAWLKIGLIAAGLACVWKQPLRRVWLVPVAGGLVLSLVAALFRSESLALLFPWRVSVWLVPVSLAVVVGWLAEIVGRRPPGRYVLAALAALGVGACLLAATLGVLGGRQLKGATEPAYRELLAAVRDQLPPGGVLLIPPHLEEFRLDARVPVWIDRKTHPYRDVEILAWKERLAAACAWYDGNSKPLEALDPEGAVALALLDPVTAGTPLPPASECTFSNAAYRLIRWERTAP